MKKQECKNCVCLVMGENEMWICDELNLPIKDVDVCPETDDTY